ncbi:MAG: CBS domain-containing protein [Candidatus Palauibacterales bacterium]|nr:CBS domain-containing protein [Candidatus Palauibacterales bacterium]
MSVLDRSVRDIMETDVVTVRPDLPIKNLIEVLEENGITGAPVVDSEENVVGVVSSTDVMRLAAKEEEESGARAAGAETDDESDFFYTGGSGGFLPALPAGLPKTRIGTKPVRDVMTRATFSVRPDASLPEAARFLHQAGIHRALVFDGGRLLGLVTTMGIVAAVAEAAGE